MTDSTHPVEPKLLAILVRPNSIYCGVALAEMQLPERCTVLGVLRNQRLIAAAQNPEIYPGDYILAMALHPMLTPALKVLLQRTHPVYYSLNDCPLAAKSKAQGQAKLSFCKQAIDLTLAHILAGSPSSPPGLPQCFNVY